jgi:CRISPR-associated protein Cmr6
MPIAAVPAYLGQDFKDASPGMRFGMYLKLWGINRRSHAALWQTCDIDYEVRGRNQEEREIKRENKFSALSDAKLLNSHDKATMASLLMRQRTAFASAGSAASQLATEAIATAPFTTGLGNEHPLENGFAFLNPYGLPYLPGSGIKGVLRQAARELECGDWDDSHGWNVAAITALFGKQGDNGDTEHLRGALVFWDVIPQIKGDSLAVDIMTPHQSHYYQAKRDRKTGDSSSPHDSGQPTPINFLTVPPGSGFVFHVQCDLVHLKRSAPELAEDGRWKALLDAALTHAFEWLGFGAKTAVGYGAMQEDPAARERHEQQIRLAEDIARRQQEESERQAALDRMTPIEREMHKFLDARQDKNQPELSALLAALKKGQWSGATKIEIAEHAKGLMVDAKKWKEKSEKKNPDKDNDYQDTLKVMAWIRGQ